MSNDGHTSTFLRRDELQWAQELLDEVQDQRATLSTVRHDWDFDLTDSDQLDDDSAPLKIGGERDADTAWNLTLDELLGADDANLDGDWPPEEAYESWEEDSHLLLAELLPDHEIDIAVERWFQRLRIPLDPAIEENFISDVLFASNALTAAGFQLTSSSLERLLMALERHELCSPPPLLEDLERIVASHHEALQSAANPEELAELVSSTYSDPSATLTSSQPADHTTPETSTTHSVPTQRQPLEPSDEFPAEEHQPQLQIGKSPPATQTGTIHERLQLLVQLHASGLITESELAKRRWEILREI